MDEYIERELAIEALSRGEGCGNVCRRAIERILAADVAPVRHGRWINAYSDIEPNPMFMYGICSECGFEQGISKYLNFCTNCGAKMDGGDSNADSVD